MSVRAHWDSHMLMSNRNNNKPVSWLTSGILYSSVAIDGQCRPIVFGLSIFWWRFRMALMYWPSTPCQALFYIKATDIIQVFVWTSSSTLEIPTSQLTQLLQFTLWSSHIDNLADHDIRRPRSMPMEPQAQARQPYVSSHLGLINLTHAEADVKCSKTKHLQSALLNASRNDQKTSPPCTKSTQHLVDHILIHDHGWIA